MWTGHICRQKVRRFKKRGNDLVNVMFLEISYFFCMHSKGILEVKKKYENVSIPIFIFVFLARSPR